MKYEYKIKIEIFIRKKKLFEMKIKKKDYQKFQMLNLSKEEEKQQQIINKQKVKNNTLNWKD